MRTLNKDQFVARKQSDTVVIYGCGYSINAINADQRQILSRYDSIGFNWFVKSKIPTRFYILREQAIFKGLETKDETRDILIRSLNEHDPNTCLVIDNLKTSNPKWASKWTYAGSACLSQLRHEGATVNETVHRDLTTGAISKLRDYDPFREGLLWDFSTISCALHLATFLKYKKIIFAGVDLYDHRYFWLDYNTLRGVTAKRKRNLLDKHFTAGFTVNLIKEYKSAFGDVELCVHNPQSLLAEIIPVWESLNARI